MQPRPITRWPNLRGPEQGTVAIIPSNTYVDRSLLKKKGQRTRMGSMPTASSSPAPHLTSKDKPDWTGDSILSNLVNAAINFPPLFAIMKVGARSAMKSTAERQGVPWVRHVDSLLSGNATTVQRLESIKNELESSSNITTYPWYYTQPFHGYDEGNMNWLAAAEVEPATDVMALRVWKKEKELGPLEAQARLRCSIQEAMQTMIDTHNLSKPNQILDIGCSVGVSSRWLAAFWPSASVTGLDLSPHFLAVAELRERQREEGSLGDEVGNGLVTPGSALHNGEQRWVQMEGVMEGAKRRQRIRYIHGNMEQTGLPDNSFDLISIQFVIHECPEEIINNVIKECKRLLRPGGLVAFCDNNPASKVIQGLPPVLFTLMKSTEPHSDSYYSTDVEKLMRDAGFEGVNTVEVDPRHRAVLGYVAE
jgi:ubiquinone/menaquinone biosynthesis C-methylase UbiE